MTEQMTEQDKKEYEQWLANTYKCDDVDRDMADWLYECVDEEIAELWKHHCQDFCFHPMKDYVAYGDTHVDTPEYITDEEDYECREQFELNTTADEVVERLVKNPSFRNCIEKLVGRCARDTDLYL